MNQRYKLPDREDVFIQSLRYHGFRKTRSRKNLKYRIGYIIPSTKHEDSGGTDFWIKMPRDERLFPVQITQYGVSLYRDHHPFATERELSEFIARTEKRIREKRARCRRHGIAFVLVRDFKGAHTNPKLSDNDIRSLRYAIAHLTRWL